MPPRLEHKSSGAGVCTSHSIGVTVSDLPFTSNAVPDTVTATGPVFVAVMSIAACPSWRPYTGTLNDVVTVSRARVARRCVYTDQKIVHNNVNAETPIATTARMLELSTCAANRNPTPSGRSLCRVVAVSRGWPQPLGRDS